MINEILDRVVSWARARVDIAGVLLVGSYARDAARPDSDVDIVILTEIPDQYTEGWYDEVEIGPLTRNQAWGPITEWRLISSSGLEVEFGVGSPDWALTDPVDAGTRRVVADGARILYDPKGLLAKLLVDVADHKEH
ncbi:nucleotidyltransferase domain-containing protein [Kibdelosporangium philippinense]|uniref:Nucleotidyltransferase domain-containing protein n=1 Tax=Kibdelosporangium philippinense TaxID=211113 RepID=A0ABS8Z6Q1_9PSEU|nr:nucleotidyltransferase domain-containing protein [Kibdelosporangium philippinense]MCE7002743.1 nucleotidyltransferase domain-containing protein [Kibdelosporangium philippinense]